MSNHTPTAHWQLKAPRGSGCSVQLKRKSRSAEFKWRLPWNKTET